MKFVSVAGLLVGSLVLVGCNPSGSKMSAICEDLIKERLRSPSTYSRVEVTRYTQDVPADTWVEGHKALTAGMVDEWKQRASEAVTSGRKLQEIAEYISYDAANAYGVPVRSLANCTYLTIDGDEGTLGSSVGKDQVRLDGFNSAEWLIESVRRSHQSGS